MADCAPCVRERAKKIGTSTAKCDRCGEPVCRRHTRRDAGVILCKDDYNVDRKEAARRIQVRATTTEPAFAGPELISAHTHQSPFNKRNGRGGYTR